MKPDLLRVTGRSRDGKYFEVKNIGVLYANVTKGQNTPTHQIAIEVDHNTGVGAFKQKHEIENALINITFADGSMWSGNFDSLKKALVPGKSDSKNVIQKINEDQAIVDEIDKWFDSLEALKRIKIAEAYTAETGDNTDLSNGLNEQGREWLAKEYHTTILNALRSEL